MTDACHPQHAVGDADLTLTVPAVPANAGALTREVSAWLGRSVRLDAQRTADVELATYEALANCVDHAYASRNEPGLMTIEVTSDTGTVRVCVTDGGRWIDPDTKPADIARGRGLRLMRGLCDDLTINGTDAGTVVCLHFENCAQVSVESSLVTTHT